MIHFFSKNNLKTKIFIFKEFILKTFKNILLLKKYFPQKEFARMYDELPIKTTVKQYLKNSKKNYSKKGD